jgi:hypothetical protein
MSYVSGYHLSAFWALGALQIIIKGTSFGLGFCPGGFGGFGLASFLSVSGR